MSYKNTLIVGMAVIGALALLTGTFVTIPTVLAYTDPNQRSIGDPDERSGSLYIRGYDDPDLRILVR